MTARMSAARARSMVGPTEGFCDATTTTTPEYVDLSRYAGKNVAIDVETNNHYIAFVEDNTVVIVTGATAVGTAAVPHIIHSGGGTPMHIFQVPKEKPWLVYRTVSGGGIIRVTLV